MFRFSVENMSSGESTDFIGQGETLFEALTDGVKNVNATTRRSGSKNLLVRTKDGKLEPRTMAEFESKQRGTDAVPEAAPIEEDINL